MENLKVSFISTNELKISHQLLDYLFEESELKFPDPDKGLRRFPANIISDVLHHYYGRLPISEAKKQFLSGFCEVVFSSNEIDAFTVDEIVKEEWFRCFNEGEVLTQWCQDESDGTVPLLPVKRTTSFIDAVFKAKQVAWNKAVKSCETEDSFVDFLTADFEDFAHTVYLFR